MRENEETLRRLEQERLIAKEATRKGLGSATVPAPLYFGVGLCNGDHQLSHGMPIDILSMLLMAERLGSRKEILVADTHAKSNGFTEEEIERTAARTEAGLKRIITNLDLENWGVIRASRFDTTPRYTTLLESIDHENEYTGRELADMAYFAGEGTTLKLGWALNGARNSSELSFDQEFTARFGTQLGFVYVVPGQTFDKKRPRAAPYFCPDPRARILLEPGEDVAAKLEAAQALFPRDQVNGCTNYLKGVARLYDRVIGERQEGSFPERLQRIVTRCTG